MGLVAVLGNGHRELALALHPQRTRSDAGLAGREPDVRLTRRRLDHEVLVGPASDRGAGRQQYCGGDDAADRNNTHLNCSPLQKWQPPGCRAAMACMAHFKCQMIFVVNRDYACAVADLARAWKLLRNFCNLGG